MDKTKRDYLIELSRLSNSELRELFNVANFTKKIEELEQHIVNKKHKDIVDTISECYLNYNDDVVKENWSLISRYATEYCLYLHGEDNSSECTCNIEIINKYINNNKKNIFVIIDGLSYVEWYDYYKTEYASTKESLINWIEQKNEIDNSILEQITIKVNPAHTTLPSATTLAHRKIFGNIKDEYKDDIIITNRYCRLVPRLINPRNIQSDTKEVRDVLVETEIINNLHNAKTILMNEDKKAAVIWLSVDGKLDDKDENEFKPGGHHKGPRGVKERIRTYITSILKFLCENQDIGIVIFSDHGMHASIDSYISNGKLVKLKSFDLKKYLNKKSIAKNVYKIERYASRGIFITMLDENEQLKLEILALKNANIIKYILDYSNNQIVNDININKKYLLVPSSGHSFNNYGYIGDHGGIEFDEYIIPEITIEMN